MKGGISHLFCVTFRPATEWSEAQGMDLQYFVWFEEILSQSS